MSLQKKKHVKNVSSKTDHQKTYVQSTNKKGLSCFDGKKKHLNANESEPRRNIYMYMIKVTVFINEAY